MGRELCENFDSARRTFEEAGDALHQDIKKLCFEGPDSELTLTANTQPALLTVSTAAHRVLMDVRPMTFAAMAGHSIGEYAAVVAAGGLSFADAVKAVRQRGLFMQQAVPAGQGGMLAVMGLGRDEIQRLCQWAVENSGESPLEPANDNAPGQVVVSGSQKVIQWLKDSFTPEALGWSGKRVRLIPLSVSAPFHCSLMKPAEDQMRRVLQDLPFQKILHAAVVQNVPAVAVREADALRENLVLQISRPVRWVECVQHLVSLGVSRTVELGSGRVLSGLIKKIDSTHLETFNIHSIEELRAFERRSVAGA